MSVSVKVDLGYEFEVRAGYDQVFDVLADVPVSVSHFPKVEQLVDLGDGVFRWEMEKVGTEQVHIQTVYASRYVTDRKHGTVTWTPVPDVGNARIAGSWTLRDNQGRSTQVELRIDGTVDVPLPALMRVVVEPVVAGEFERLVEQYIQNLVERFGGEV